MDYEYFPPVLPEDYIEVFDFDTPSESEQKKAIDSRIEEIRSEILLLDTELEEVAYQITEYKSRIQQDSNKKKDPQEEEKLIRLPQSKSPIIEALIYCALKNQAASLICQTENEVKIKIADWKQLLKNCDAVQSKAHPTAVEANRIKTFRRWFQDIPRKKVRETTSSIISARSQKHNNKVKEVAKIIEHIKNLIRSSEDIEVQ